MGDRQGIFAGLDIKGVQWQLKLMGHDVSEQVISEMLKDIALDEALPLGPQSGAAEIGCQQRPSYISEQPNVAATSRSSYFTEGYRAYPTLGEKRYPQCTEAQSNPRALPGAASHLVSERAWELSQLQQTSYDSRTLAENMERNDDVVLVKDVFQSNGPAASRSPPERVNGLSDAHTSPYSSSRSDLLESRSARVYGPGSEDLPGFSQSFHFPAEALQPYNEHIAHHYHASNAGQLSIRLQVPDSDDEGEEEDKGIEEDTEGDSVEEVAEEEHYLDDGGEEYSIEYSDEYSNLHSTSAVANDASASLRQSSRKVASAAQPAGHASSRSISNDLSYGSTKSSLRPSSRAVSSTTAAKQSKFGQGPPKKTDRVAKYKQYEEAWRKDRFLNQGTGRRNETGSYHLYFAAQHNAAENERRRTLDQSRAQTKKVLSSTAKYVLQSEKRRDGLRTEPRKPVPWQD